LNICLAFISLPYALVVSFLYPPMLGIYAMQGKFAEAVNPAKAWRLARANLNGFLTAWLLSGIVGVAASLIGTILCVIGIYPLGAYAGAVGAHLYGQAYREGMASPPAA
jgi:ABC-type spermidine/putrescine transport system permease subunit II